MECAGLRSLSFWSTQPTRSLHHGPIVSSIFHELLVGSRLTDGAPFQKEDVVSPLHQVKTLGDEKHRPRAPLKVFIQDPFHLRKDMNSVRAGDTPRQGDICFQNCDRPRQLLPTTPILSKSPSEWFSVKPLTCYGPFT